MPVLEAVEPAVVRAHLRELLESKPMAGSPRLGRFLTFVVETTLNGDSACIKEYVIATEVYGKGADYDPQIDSTVRVEASRLRGKLREYYASLSVEPPVRIELPKGCYVPDFVTRDALPEVLPQLTVPTRRYLPVASAVAAVSVLVIVAGFGASSGSAASVDTSVREQYLQADRLLRQRVDESKGVVPANVLESIAAFKGIVDRVPSFTPAWVGLAEAEEWAYELDKTHPRARLDEAAVALRSALKNNPDAADAHSRLASIYFHGLGDTRRAEDSARRAAKLNPGDIRNQVRLADLLRIKGRSDDALDVIGQALALQPTAGRLWAHRALVLYDLSRYDEAISTADHTIAMDDGNQFNQTAMARWVRGLSLERLGRLGEAEATYRQAIAAWPKDHWNRPSLGHLLGKTGRRGEAEQIASQLAAEEKSGKPVAFAVALVYAGMGDRNEAQRWLDHGRKTGDTSMPFLAVEKRFSDLRL